MNIFCASVLSIASCVLQSNDWTIPGAADAAFMNNAFKDGERKMSVADKLVMWKEMPIGSKEEQRCETQLLEQYRKHIKNTDADRVFHVHSLWAVQLLPFALGGVDQEKADFLWQISHSENRTHSEKRTGSIKNDLEMRIVHGLACGRRGFTDDATNMVESVIEFLEFEQTKPDSETNEGNQITEFFGKPRTVDDILHECYGYRAVIRSINIQTIGGNTENSNQEEQTSSSRDQSQASDGATVTIRDENLFADPADADTGTPFDANINSVPVRTSLEQADEDYLCIFEIDQNVFVSKAIRDQESVDLGVSVWERITTIFPLHYRREIVQFNIQGGQRWAGFFNGSGKNDVGRKGYSLSVAKFTAENEAELADADRPITPRRGTLDWTLVHEMGHYICLRSNAIELFSQEFDGDNMPQPERRKSPDDYAENGSPKLVGNFVTSYAERAGGDEEVVETFTTYMTVDKLPEGDSLVEKKIRFFEKMAGFPELRDHIQQLNGKKTLR